MADHVVKQKLKKCWNAFNYWRKRYFPLRLTILLLIAVPLLYERIVTRGEPIICNFVRIACQAIENCSQPRVVSAWLRYNHSLEKQRLLLSLNKIKDQLSPEERAALNVKPTQANLKQLFDLAQRHGILPKTANLRTMKRAMLTRAIGETRQFFEPENQKVSRMIDSCSYPDYSKLITWKSGLVNFARCLQALFFPRPFRTTASWLLICFFFGTVMGVGAKKAAETSSVIFAVSVTLILISLNHIQVLSELSITMVPKVFNSYAESLLMHVYQLCIAAAITLFGCRLSRKAASIIDHHLAVSVTLCGLSLSIVYASYGLFCIEYYDYYYTMYWAVNYSLILKRQPYLAFIIFITGAALFAYSLHRFLFYYIKHRKFQPN